MDYLEPGGRAVGALVLRISAVGVQMKTLRLPSHYRVCHGLAFVPEDSPG
jgi:hypothetical protein